MKLAHQEGVQDLTLTIKMIKGNQFISPRDSTNYVKLLLFHESLTTFLQFKKDR